MFWSRMQLTGINDWNVVSTTGLRCPHTILKYIEKAHTITLATLRISVLTSPWHLMLLRSSCLRGAAGVSCTVVLLAGGAATARNHRYHRRAAPHRPIVAAPRPLVATAARQVPKNRCWPLCACETEVRDTGPVSKPVAADPVSCDVHHLHLHLHHRVEHPQLEEGDAVAVGDAGVYGVYSPPRAAH